MKDTTRKSPDEDRFVWKSPFAALKGAAVSPPSAGEAGTAPRKANDKTLRKNRGRVEILRQTAHRGGKTVTVVTGFAGISLAEKEQLARQMQKSCGAGGTVKEGRIEIQGDQRELVAAILTKAGFRPVCAGG